MSLCCGWHPCSSCQRTASLTSVTLHRFYSMRIENREGPVLPGIAQFSIPARCFEASLQAAHRMDMHLSYYDTLMGFQWRHQRTLDCSIENRVDMRSWPAKSDVSLLLPQVSPEPRVAMMDGAPPSRAHCFCACTLYLTSGCCLNLLHILFSP